MEKHASIKMDALNKQLEANRTAKERAAAAKEEAMAAAALVEAETDRDRAAAAHLVAARKVEMVRCRRHEWGEAMSAMSSRSHHYAHRVSIFGFRASADNADFCIQLLPPPKLGSDPAHALCQEVGRLEPGTTKVGVQAAWLEALGDGASRWPDSVGGKALTLTFAGTHHSPFNNGQKPDNSHFATGGVAGQANTAVVAFGMLTGRIHSHFGAYAKGEIFKLAESFLRVQPETAGVTAYLTDGHWIQFFRVNRAPGTVQGFTYIEGPLFILQTSAGQQWFWGLMTTHVEGLGWDGPQLHIGTTPLTVVRLLGSGSTGTVYHCTYAHTEDGGGEDAAAGAGAGAKACTRDVVVKVCSSTDYADEERTMLQRLNTANVPGVQQFVAVTDCGRGVVTTPLGARLSLDTPNVGNVLAGVVTTLQRMHELNLVHRDVSRSNILVGPDGKSLLIDVGGAVQPGVPVPYHGTIDYAAPRILEHRVAYLAGAASYRISALASDDLQSLVRVANLLMFGYKKRGAPYPQQEAEYLEHRLAALELVGAHAEADAHAVGEDYTFLRRYFVSFFNAYSRGGKKRKAPSS